jgi:7,8-dihydropterin-6-yl-methyl-4-(beta-D-ribofuranosyl)aminobenzene 5'-phosphate synthase
MQPFRRLGLFLFLAFGAAAAEPPARVQQLRITVLSTMLADGDELGEWGFAALVEVDGHKILFDTGAHSDVVLKNARSLNLDLSGVPDVILSHSHSDHVGGLLTLRRDVQRKNPAALARAHVGDGMFLPRIGDRPPLIEHNPMIAMKEEFESSGGAFVVHAQPVQLYPGVWLTGRVPRTHPERNWSGALRLKTGETIVEDNVPEDMALVIDTAAGLVIVTGCGHAGVINIVEHARAFVRPARVHALIGGIHLFSASAATLGWTTGKLRAAGLDHFLGAHCTGVETVYRFRQDLGLDRARCVVAAVGAKFELGRGIDPRAIAK